MRIAIELTTPLNVIYFRITQRLFFALLKEGFSQAKKSSVPVLCNKSLENLV